MIPAPVFHPDDEVTITDDRVGTLRLVVASTEPALTGGSAKSLIDCLTRLGFWRDDNPKWLDRRYNQRPQTPDEHRAGTRTLVEIERALA